MVRFSGYSSSNPKHGISSILLAILAVCTLISGSAASDFDSCFAKSFADSASAVCGFRQGSMRSLLQHRQYDLTASDLGMRNFFVAYKLFGRPYACEHAMSVYGPRGFVRAGLLSD